MYLGLVFFTDILYHKTGTSLIPCPSLSLVPIPTSSCYMFQFTRTRIHTSSRSKYCAPHPVFEFRVKKAMYPPSCFRYGLGGPWIQCSILQRTVVCCSVLLILNFNKRVYHYMANNRNTERSLHNSTCNTMHGLEWLVWGGNTAFRIKTISKKWWRMTHYRVQ